MKNVGVENSIIENPLDMVTPPSMPKKSTNHCNKNMIEDYESMMDLQI